MKRVFTSLTASLFVLWYLLSVIGFGVHTCTSTGETYIATVATGFACEDLHPARHTHAACHSCCGCHHEDGTETVGAVGLKSCCVAEFQVITLTGTRAYEKSQMFDNPVDSVVTMIDESVSSWSSGYFSYNIFPKPRSLIGPSRDYQVSYGIWRI